MDSTILNNKIIKWIKSLFLVTVPKNKFNFYFEVTIKLFYFIRISYILEPTIPMFPYFAFSPKILAKWLPFWIFVFEIQYDIRTLATPSIPIFIKIGRLKKKVAPRGCKTTPKTNLKIIFLVLFMKSLFWILINNCTKRIFFTPKCRICYFLRCTATIKRVVKCIFIGEIDLAKRKF